MTLDDNDDDHEVMKTRKAIEENEVYKFQTQ